MMIFYLFIKCVLYDVIPTQEWRIWCSCIHFKCSGFPSIQNISVLHICNFSVSKYNYFINSYVLLLFNRETLFRLTITASCPMDLQYFPMDSQLCYIEIESCKYRHGRAFSSEYSLVFIHKMFLKSVLTKSTLKCHLTSWPSFPSLWIANFYQY